MEKRRAAPHRRGVADALIELGRVLSDLGRPEEAEPALEEGARILRDVLGPAHPDVGAAEAVLASVRGR